MKLEGSIETFPLHELIDMVCYSSVTGVLNIFNAGPQGHLYFRDGVLYHVVRGTAKGVDGLAELIELSEGHFAFVSDAVSPEESLWGPLHHHMLNAERIAARWKQMRAYVPNLDLIPLLCVAPEVALRRVGPAHQQVLQAIDGQTSLRQMAAKLGWAEIDVAEAVVQMTVDGLVELRSQRPSNVAPRAEAPTQTERGLFDRIRTRAGIPSQRNAEQRNAEPVAVRTPEPPRTQEDLILHLLRS